MITRTRVMPVSNWSFYKQEWRSYQYYKDKGGKYKEGAEADDPMMSGDFMAEDVFVCEQQQKSLASPLFSVGATAKKQEASVRGFQQWILRSVTA